jgi:hypothetical protein
MKVTDVRYSDHYLSKVLFWREHAWNMFSSILLVFPALEILILSGCAGPSINRFDVTPQVLCGNQSAVATWNVNGAPAINFSVEPAPLASGRCEASDRETFAFDLVVQKQGKEASKQVEVVRIADGSAEPVVFPTSRLEGSDVVANGEKNPALWTGSVRIGTLASCQKRPIEVEHSGKTVLLTADGSPSDALAGAELTGTWELRSPLDPQEQANPRLRPKQLEIMATLRCVKQETP